MSNWLLRSRIDRVGHEPFELRDFNPSWWDTLSPEQRVGTLLNGKPPYGTGLWYQLGNEWENSVLFDGEEPNKFTRTILAVNPARLDILETLDEVREFWREYSVTPEGLSGPAFEVGGFNPFRGLDWRRIMTDLDGIELRVIPSSATIFDHEARWVHGWDVLSGVVWNAATALRVVRRESPLSQPAPFFTDFINLQTTELPVATTVKVGRTTGKVLGKSLSDLPPGRAPKTLIPPREG